MIKGVDYEIRIDAYKNCFKCYVDNVLMSSDCDNTFPGGSVAIILWEDNGKTHIIADIDSMKVYKLSEKKEIK